MSDDSSIDPRVDTLRPAATAGLGFFSAVRPIAVAVGVSLPPDPDLAARFAVTEDIDLSALLSDAATLRAVATAAGDSAVGAADVAGRVSSVWSGSAADAAHDCVGRHVGRAEAAVEHIREVATAAQAAASAISRVLVAKYLSVAAVHTDLVAGRPMAELTTSDVAENREVIASDITAKLALFDRAVEVAEHAIVEILTVLAASYEGGPTARYPEPVGWTVPARSRARRRDAGPAGATRPGAAARSDVTMGAFAPTAHGEVTPRRAPEGAGERTRSGARRAPPGTDPAVSSPHAGASATPRPTAPSDAPVSMVAALAEAAIASASAVGMAAAGGLGAALNMAIDAMTPDGAGPGGFGPGGFGPGGLSTGGLSTGGFDGVLAPGASVMGATPDPGTVILNLDLDPDHGDDRDHGDLDPSVPQNAAPTDPPPAQMLSVPVVPVPPSGSPAAPPVPAGPGPTPSPGDDEPAVDSAPDGDQTDGDQTAGDRTDEPAANTTRQPSASPDPGDDGGLALAGDR